MKYIRTKDEIFEIIEQDIENHCFVVKVNENRHDLIHKSLGIKQADTIEELCDEFVDISELKTTNTGGWLYDEFDRDNKCLVYYAEDERITIPLNEFDDLSKIYGAIWTDKGLIYIAKMNDKGELELL